jgi:hypothetical protein
MAYLPAELRLISGGNMSNLGGPNIWSLDGEDAQTAADAAGFVSDARARGVRLGDIVYYRQWAAVATKASLTNITIHFVAGINSTTGAGDLSNLASVTMTNTD